MFKLLKFILTLQLLAFSHQTLAAKQCSRVFSEVTRSQEEKFLPILAEVKNEIDQLIFPLKPWSVNIQLSKNFLRSHFDFDTSTLRVGLHDGKSLQEKDLGVMAHEYGHALLHKNHPYPRNTGMVDTFALESFHELFADVVAVVYTKNPKAIHIAVESYQNKPTHLTRDFTINSEKNYALWLRDVRAKFRVGPHQAFNPVKWALWDIVKDKIHSDAYRKMIIPELYEIIKSDFAKAATPRSPDAKQVFFWEANQAIADSLIERLYQSKLALPIEEALK